MDCLINATIHWYGDENTGIPSKNKYLYKNTTMANIPTPEVILSIDGYDLVITDVRYELQEEFIEMGCKYQTAYINDYNTTVSGLGSRGWNEVA